MTAYHAVAEAEAVLAAVETRQRRGRTLRHTSTLLLVLLFVAGAGMVILGLREPRPVAPPAGPAGARGPATPFDEAVAALRAQSAALLRGDERAFVAVAGTALQTRYHDMFRALRALGVTRFDYLPDPGQNVPGDPAGVSVRVDILYCFGADMCPARPADGWAYPPRIAQTLTFRPVAGRYVIGKVATGPRTDPHQPTPWENGKLVVAQGRRVTLLAAPAQAGYLAKVLPVAEAAARIDDKFAAMYGTPQHRYRIYLAGDKQWKAWYQGEKDQWAIGVAVPLNRYGLDVMLRISQIDDPQILRLALQHEFAHVVTLDGSVLRTAAGEQAWIVEGIAEYIGWWPRRAAQSFRVPSVHSAVHGARAPKTIALTMPGANASQAEGDAFYGLAHFAMDCMARRYGQGKLVDFVRRVLVGDQSYDQAARAAYGVPFAALDKTCVAWLKQQV